MTIEGIHLGYSPQSVGCMTGQSMQPHHNRRLFCTSHHLRLRVTPLTPCSTAIIIPVHLFHPTEPPSCIITLRYIHPCLAALHSVVFVKPVQKLYMFAFVCARLQHFCSTLRTSRIRCSLHLKLAAHQTTAHPKSAHQTTAHLKPEYKQTGREV